MNFNISVNLCLKLIIEEVEVEKSEHTEEGVEGRGLGRRGEEGWGGGDLSKDKKELNIS